MVLGDFDPKGGIEEKLFLESTMHRFGASKNEANWAIHRAIEVGVLQYKDGKYYMTD